MSYTAWTVNWGQVRHLEVPFLYHECYIFALVAADDPLKSEIIDVPEGLVDRTRKDS